MKRPGKKPGRFGWGHKVGCPAQSLVQPGGCQRGHEEKRASARNYSAISGLSAWGAVSTTLGGVAVFGTSRQRSGTHAADMLRGHVRARAAPLGTGTAATLPAQ